MRKNCSRMRGVCTAPHDYVYIISTMTMKTVSSPAVGNSLSQFIEIKTFLFYERKNSFNAFNLNQTAQQNSQDPHWKLLWSGGPSPERCITLKLTHPKGPYPKAKQNDQLEKWELILLKSISWNAKMTVWINLNWKLTNERTSGSIKSFLTKKKPLPNYSYFICRDKILTGL